MFFPSSISLFHPPLHFYSLYSVVFKGSAFFPNLDSCTHIFSFIFRSKQISRYSYAAINSHCWIIMLDVNAWAYNFDLLYSIFFSPLPWAPLPTLSSYKYVFLGILSSVIKRYKCSYFYKNVLRNIILHCNKVNHNWMWAHF